jgi:hypothetical protein
MIHQLVQLCVNLLSRACDALLSPGQSLASGPWDCVRELKASHAGAHLVLCNAGVIMFGQNQFSRGHATAGAVLVWVCLTAPTKVWAAPGGPLMRTSWRRPGAPEVRGTLIGRRIRRKLKASQNAFPGLVRQLGLAELRFCQLHSRA